MYVNKAVAELEGSDLKREPVTISRQFLAVVVDVAPDQCCPVCRLVSLLEVLTQTFFVPSSSPFAPQRRHHQPVGSL